MWHCVIFFDSDTCISWRLLIFTFVLPSIRNHDHVRHYQQITLCHFYHFESRLFMEEYEQKGDFIRQQNLALEAALNRWGSHYILTYLNPFYYPPIFLCLHPRLQQFNFFISFFFFFFFSPYTFFLNLVAFLFVCVIFNLVVEWIWYSCHH